MLASEREFVLDRNSSLKSGAAKPGVAATVLPFALLVKRCLDLLLAGLLLVLLLPVFVIIGLLVAMEDGRPVFYRRRVVGPGGEFDAFKFRSMRRDADLILASNPDLKAEFEHNFKLKNDPRVTRVGNVLRKHSLDELPQLFNVVRGQMSLVGPRMITAPELQKYGPYQELLLSVKPGITGLWQVRGRQNVSYNERVSMDVHYIQNWNLGIDLRILAETPIKVLRKEGAF
jgi:lipopolysaccharide/colanic/teichoic acid biosynthesis glycosyltransferase